MRTAVWASIALAITMAAPAAIADSWSAYGNAEPDTPTLDSTSFMFFSPPAAGTSGVYFSGFETAYPLLNPNVAATGSRIESFSYLDVAVLGRWTDCNQDGYVGIAETAMEEYPAQVLSADQADTICPDGGDNNAAGWVTEFRWIGTNFDPGAGNAYNTQRDPRMIADNSSMVWTDEGVSFIDQKEFGGISCWINFVHGTFYSTGDFLNWADCFDGYLVGQTANSAQPGTVPAGGYNWKGSVADMATFGSDNADNNAAASNMFDCSQSVAQSPYDQVQQPVNSTAQSDKPDFSALPTAGSRSTANDAYDFAAGLGNEHFAQSVGLFLVGTTFGVGHPTAAGGPSTNAPQPGAGAPGGWGGGNVPSTLNETNEETRGDCNTHNDGGNDFYGPVDSNFRNAVGRMKRQPDYVLGFGAQSRGQSVDATTDGTPLNPSTPSCLGGGMQVNQANLLVLCESNWASGTIVNPPRDSYQLGKGHLAEQDRHYQTYYAVVDGADGALPGGTGTYGATQCGIIATGAAPSGGWECDPGLWWLNDDGTAAGSITHPVPKVGTVYNLRDVDCNDGRIAGGVPVFAGPGALGATCDEAYS